MPIRRDFLRTASASAIVVFLVLGFRAPRPEAAGQAARQPAQATPSTLALENSRLRAQFVDGRLVSVTERSTGQALTLEDERFVATVSGVRLDSTRAQRMNVQREDTRVVATYTFPTATVTATYELRPEWGFVSKRLRIEPTGATSMRLGEVVTLEGVATPTAAETLPLTEGRFGVIQRWPQREGRGVSLWLMHQNPYNVYTLESGLLRASYTADMDWQTAWGTHETDRLLIGLAPRSSRLIPARAVPEWIHVPDYERYLREQPVVDEAEVDAMVEAVRAFLLYRPTKSLRLHVPWTENDYQIDVSTPEGWAEYQRIFDMAAQLGATTTIFAPANSGLSKLSDNKDAWGWENLLFFGLGQKLRRGEWVPGRDAVPASLQTMIDAARAKGLGLVAYAYPTLPFLQDPTWTRWAKGELGGYRGVDTGQRGFQDWWVNTLEAFTKSTGAAGFSFDHWWIAYDDPNATSKYAQWYGTRRILETARERMPNVLMDGRQQYMSFGPWTWLAGSYPHPTLTDEQPESFLAFPDLHTDRVSANRQRFAAWKYRVERFTPPEIMPGYITHQTERTDDKKVMRRDRFRPRDWDVLGWKFSLLSSIGTAPFNHTLSYVPARDEAEYRALSAADKAWFKGWLDWTDTHAETLRHLKPILGPPMIGRVDGTAAIVGSRGFIFLYNPNYRALDATFTLDGSIGLTEGTTYTLRVWHPEEGRHVGKPGAGFWTRGDEVRISVPASEAMVLELVPVGDAATPTLFGVTGTVDVRGDVVTVRDAKGEPGTSRLVQIALPSTAAVRRLVVNGATVPFRQDGAVVEATVGFAGQRFGRAEAVVPYSPTFAGGRVEGRVTVPARVKSQLAARKAAWPVPYTEDDLKAPWLGSHRLLLFVQVAEPREGMDVRLEINGKPVPLTRAYNSIYGHSPDRTFLGWYADVSALPTGVAHRIAVQLPELAPGRFQGVFFENVEPEWTTTIRAGSGVTGAR